MKKLFLSAFIAGLAASPAQADEGFGDAELRLLAPFFEEAQCQARCNTPDWVIERVTMPRGARTVAPDDRLYNVYTQPHGCGAGRCYEAFILRDSSSLTVIKHGLSVSPLRTNEIPALASRSKLTRINRVSGASIVSAVSPARPSSKGLGVNFVDVEVTANARVRDHPTTNGSVVLGVITPGRFLSGEWVPADDGNGQWLRIDLASLDEIQGQSSWPYGYIWDGNLRSAQPASNGPGAAGPSSTLRSDLQARADRFYAAADLSSALEALADIVNVLTKMRDAGELYIATQVFEVYDAPGSELALADMTRKNGWTLAQMVSTGLLKGWYARAKETGREPPIRYEYAEVMVQNVLYAARAGSGDVPGAIADASGDQIDRIKEIAITYQQIRGQNEILVHNALNSALLDLDRYSRGELDYKFVLQNIINSRKIATNLDSTTRRVMRDDTPTRLAIVADLQEVKLKVLRGDDVSVLLESMKAQYQGNAFAKDAAFLLGVPCWNRNISSSKGADRAIPRGVAPAQRKVLCYVGVPLSPQAPGPKSADTNADGSIDAAEAKVAWSKFPKWSGGKWEMKTSITGISVNPFSDKHLAQEYIDKIKLSSASIAKIDTCNQKFFMQWYGVEESLRELYATEFTKIYSDGERFEIDYLVRRGQDRIKRNGFLVENRFILEEEITYQIPGKDIVITLNSVIEGRKIGQCA